MSTQSEKAKKFQLLHQRDRAFIIPNPWDAGSTVLLAQMGFEAVATTSAGYAFSAAKQDAAVNRDEMLAHAAVVVAATDLPVSADMENGYGDSPEIVNATVRLAVGTGLAGCSIEDVTPERVTYGIEHAADRIRAAVDAAHSFGFPFMLTARCENFIVGRPDLKDTIQRLQAYQQAGADVLFAPGLTKREDIVEVVRSVDRPLNVIMAIRGADLTLDELSAMGVKRISVGSALARTALTALLNAARDMREHGRFTFAENAVSYPEFNAMFGKASRE